MRVLFLTDSLSDIDGVGQYTLRLIEAMQRLEPDLEVEVLLARKHRPTSKSLPADWQVDVALPPDYFYYMTPLRFWVSLVQSVLRTRKSAKQADIIHAIKDYPHNLVGALAGKLSKTPCVATAHGTYSVQPLLEPRHRARALKTYGRFRAMISVSNYTKRRLVELLEGQHSLDPARLHVVPNCVDAPYFAEPRDVGEPPWHNKRFTLAIGEVKERKGHHLSLPAFIRVAAAEPDLHHFLVGRLSNDDYERELRGMVSVAGLDERVHFLGNISEDEKVDLLQRAEVFVHTPVTASDGGFEGFGIVYLEAAAAGTVAIGSLDCGAEDAIRDGETGLLVEQTVDAVAAALERLLGDPVFASRLAQEARAHAGDVTWDMNARAVLAIYHEALEESAKGG
jgi:phosphatidylinositol alpha-1,6-mannosyltransferase